MVTKQKRKVSKYAKSKAKTASPRRMNLDEGPREWLLPVLESAYTRMEPKEQAQDRPAASLAAPEKIDKERAEREERTTGAYRSRLQPGRDETALAYLSRSRHWTDRLGEYHRRKLALSRAAPAAAAAAPMPAIPGATNWTTIGPAGVDHGYARGRPITSGRTSGIAVAPGGQRIYIATANGGVWRSDDGGATWKSTMDAFDQDPTNFASTSLACGAIAIDEADPNRVYVGTGEGDTDAIFSSRLTNALPAYRGIGPIRSDDGGNTWALENVAAGSTPLAGAAFYALAVDPANRENVVAATTVGLYQRVTQGGVVQWIQRRAGSHSSVVVGRAGGATIFYAAAWGDRVYKSTDGTNWTPLGAISGALGRIALATQRATPSVLYALVATDAGKLKGVYRLKSAGSGWARVTGAPTKLIGTQGDYDLAIAVDPVNANRIVLGGDTNWDTTGGGWYGSIYRCTVAGSGSSYSMTSNSVGMTAHADVHCLVYTPNNSQEVWAGCDGGVFRSANAGSTSMSFQSRNKGLATLCTNYFAQHPTDTNIVYCGLQDNGTARRDGAGAWRNVFGGDGGYCVVNWADPNKVLNFANGHVQRATDGGLDDGSWSDSPLPAGWMMMVEPMVGSPASNHPADADLVAIGAGTEVYVSTDFGLSWQLAASVGGGIYALVFATAKRLFVGTTNGEVWRLDRQAAQWAASRIDNVPAGALGVAAPVSDIAVDWSDATRRSVYVALGGVGDFRHVWRFNGQRWSASSGASGSATSLLDVEHNAIIVDPVQPQNVYVGADVGVWHSADRGATWQPLSNGLPDAPVFDLQMHGASRRLRASTHGRGLFEYKL
jgi:hypothetical protein